MKDWCLYSAGSLMAPAPDSISWPSGVTVIFASRRSNVSEVIRAADFQFSPSLDVITPRLVDLYVWESDDFDGQLYCGGDWGGCFRHSTDRIYSGAATVEHELVHAITTDFPNRDAFFEEGLAEALSMATQFGQYAPRFPVGSSADVDYPSAGHFVRWLFETRGIEPLLAHMDTDGGIAQFEAIYEQSLDDLTSTYFTDAAWRYPRLYDYPTPSFEVQGDELWSSDLDFACSRDDIRGAKDGLEAIRELTLPKSGYYAIWSSTGGRIRGRAKSVDAQASSSVAGYAFALPGGELATGPLEAGPYEVGVVAPPGVESGVIVVWESLAPVPVPPGGLP